MRILSTLGAAVLGLAIFGCDSGSITPGDTSSFIIIRNSTTDATVSTPDSKGAITLEVGDERDFEIIRTVESDNAADVVTDVTADADFNFTNPSVAHMDADGILHADAAGFTTLEVVFRDDDGDETDDDTVSLDVTVNPASILP